LNTVQGKHLSIVIVIHRLDLSTTSLSCPLVAVG